jgi:uncharacterized protein YxeA
MRRFLVLLSLLTPVIICENLIYASNVFVDPQREDPFLQQEQTRGIQFEGDKNLQQEQTRGLQYTEDQLLQQEQTRDLQFEEDKDLRQEKELERM